MAPTIPGIEGINWASALSGVMYWLKWGVYSIVMIVGMIIGYVFLTYNIKATVFPLYGSGKDGVFSVQKSKTNRLRWNKGRTAWKQLMPVGNKKEIEPFDSEFIYPGNRVYIFDLNGEFIPGRININKTEDQIRAEINPVPYYIRNWQSLQHKKNAIEYAENSWWDDNKIIISALMAALAILAAGLVFIYLTYKMAGAGSSDIANLADAIRNVGVVPDSGTVPK